jgi:hypothetical protein
MDSKRISITMSNYTVNFEYYEPMLAGVTLEADTELQAAAKAEEEFEKLYPEAVDAEIISISETPF